jgi:hypothetical protein
MATRHDRVPPGEGTRPPGRHANKPKREPYPARPDLTDYIQQLLDAAPPLTDEQHAELSQILWPHHDQHNVAQPPRDAAA